MNNIAVSIKDLCFKYPNASKPALKDICLSFKEGEIALLIGPTGAGKSTLYMCLMGLIPHLLSGKMSGSVNIVGMDTREYDVAELSQKIGIVFQDPEIQIFSLSVEEELAFGPENLGLPKLEIRRRINEAVSTIGLQSILDREPARLSGGQQQTVAIGSVWSMLPDVLIMDEPTSNLDPEGSLRVLNLIRKLNKEYHKTILVVEHKIDEIADIAEHVFVMDQGQILMNGSPYEVFSQTEKLHSLGVVAPISMEMAFALKEMGYKIDPPFPLNLNEGLAYFNHLVNGKEEG